MSKPISSREEKRSFIRLKIDTMITFTLMEGSGERYQGRCRNISGAGLLFETDKKLQVGDKLTLTVPSENEDFSNLNAVVEVIRCSSKNNQQYFEVGVLIKQIRS